MPTTRPRCENKRRLAFLSDRLLGSALNVKSLDDFVEAGLGAMPTLQGPYRAFIPLQLGGKERGI